MVSAMFELAQQLVDLAKKANVEVIHVDDAAHIGEHTYFIFEFNQLLTVVYNESTPECGPSIHMHKLTPGRAMEIVDKHDLLFATETATWRDVAGIVSILHRLQRYDDTGTIASVLYE